MDRKRTVLVGPPRARKRIAFACFSRSLGGLELSTIRLAVAMSERGNTVLLIVPPGSPLQQRAVEAGVEAAVLEPRWKYGDLMTAFHLGRLLRDNRVDVLLLMQSKDIHLASIASLIAKNTKLVFYQQMDSGYNKRDPFHTLFYSRLSRWISLTENMKSNVQAFTRVPDGKVDVIPLGVDLRRFDPAKHDRSRARAFFGLPEKGPLIGVLGRLDPQKGQEVFLRAVPALVKKHANAHFVIAGDETAGEADYKNSLERLCKNLAIREHVTFLPFTNDVPRLLAALNIVVLPSYFETYGLVVIEAMAMERPVIATNAGGVPEIITDGRTGILVEPRDSVSLARAIHRLLTSAPLRVRITRLAREEVLRRFDFDLCVDRLLTSLDAMEETPRSFGGHAPRLDA